MNLQTVREPTPGHRLREPALVDAIMQDFCLEYNAYIMVAGFRVSIRHNFDAKAVDELDFPR